MSSTSHTMRQQTYSNAPALTSSNSNFTPRKEFTNAIQRSSSFALLSLAGTGLVRLSSFPPNVINDLRLLFERLRILRVFREDAQSQLSEFNLDRKPWATSSSVESEKLLVDIICLLYRHGYVFVSTINYGRENDERLSMAFSRPRTPPSGSPPTKVVPFALSFPSPMVLRVVSPPLNSTPAILQGVRSAWNRGVASEKKVREDCYEFKLKGYRWFAENNFAIDSLQHIISLLNAMDTHGFTLLTSLNLSGRNSRMKDLWIFAGSSDDNNTNNVLSLPPPTSFNLSRPINRRHSSFDPMPPFFGSVPRTRVAGHMRSPSDSDVQYSSGLSGLSQLGSSSSLIAPDPPFAKHASNGQSSHMLAGPSANTHPTFRPLGQMNRTAHPGEFVDVDMTGIGTIRMGRQANYPPLQQPHAPARQVLYETGPLSLIESQRRNLKVMNARVPDASTPSQSSSSMPSAPEGGPSPDNTTPSSPSTRPSTPMQNQRPALANPHPTNETYTLPASAVHQGLSLPEIAAASSDAALQWISENPLLPAAVFRDSEVLSSDGFSSRRDTDYSSTGVSVSCEVPIAWTGVGREVAEGVREERGVDTGRIQDGGVPPHESESSLDLIHPPLLPEDEVKVMQEPFQAIPISYISADDPVQFGDGAHPVTTMQGIPADEQNLHYEYAVGSLQQASTEPIATATPNEGNRQVHWTEESHSVHVEVLGLPILPRAVLGPSTHPLYNGNGEPVPAPEAAPQQTFTAPALTKTPSTSGRKLQKRERVPVVPDPIPKDKTGWVLVDGEGVFPNTMSIGSDEATAGDPTNGQGGLGLAPSSNTNASIFADPNGALAAPVPEAVDLEPINNPLPVVSSPSQSGIRRLFKKSRSKSRGAITNSEVVGITKDNEEMESSGRKRNVSSRIRKGRS